MTPNIAQPNQTVSSPFSIFGMIRKKWRTYDWQRRLEKSKFRPYIQLLNKASALEGDVVECGVYQGRSLIRMALFLKQSGIGKKVYGLDSFEGFPSVDSVDVGPGRSEEQLNRMFKKRYDIAENLRSTAGDLDLNLTVMEGYFEETLPSLIDHKFCFVHLDCDIYESYQTCLNTLYDSVVQGGIILFDEYHSDVWPGATRAIDEFFQGKPEKPQQFVCKDSEYSRYYVVKS